ncbi:hypothetical protein WOLCODRAFT_144208 [Wolfiporia cocos MD-104 SS10]|uniref:Uncharacterized protein n=1 Tax=Wolfiporia cocos (strain MD-104) TaxID=742152 RepID=A0A2H3JMQ4_WOLCO|nr:hypothetical protein WOLCODRAFT_144208 [Wolfiporia cocos MD-104 SS10]
MPGAVQDGEQCAIVFALVRQFRVAEDEYRARFCGPDDAPLMCPGRLDHFPPQVGLGVDFARPWGDAHGDAEGAEEVDGVGPGSPRVKIEVEDDDLRSPSYEPSSRRVSPAPEAYYDPGAPAPWESDDEDVNEQEAVGTDAVKQEDIDSDIGTVSQAHDERADFVNSADLFADEEPAVKQEDESRQSGYDSDEWLYGNSSAPYLDTDDRNAEVKHEDTYPDPANMNSDDWLYGPGYTTSGVNDEEPASDIDESGDERGHIGDDEASTDDDDDAASISTIRSYHGTRARSAPLLDIEMSVEREMSPVLDYGTDPTSSDVSEVETPPPYPHLALEDPVDIVDNDIPDSPHRLVLHPRPLYWLTISRTPSPSSPPPLITSPLRTPSPPLVLHPSVLAPHNPSPPPGLHPARYVARTPSPPPAAAGAESDTIPSPSTFAESYERGQAPAVTVAPAASTSGVQRRQGSHEQRAHAAPYVRPAPGERRAWARLRIRSPTPMDVPVAPYSVRIPFVAREQEQETTQQMNNIHDDL